MSRSLSVGLLADYTIDIDDVARYILVCRESWSADRDDVAVDSIAVECR